VQRKELTIETAPAAVRRWLSRRDYSRAELQQRLELHGLPGAQARELVEELAQTIWQCDDRYAEMRLRSRARAGYGPRYIAAELQGHGIDAVQFEQACVETDVDWLVAGREALRRCRSSDPHKQRQHLHRKGFEPEHIRALLGR
jgi:regulatory protein